MKVSAAAAKKPKKRNAVATKKRILDAATSVFARHGFEAAPLSELISIAKVNQRMVYHYFGSKRGLYQAVFEREWKELASSIETELKRDAAEASLQRALFALDRHFARRQDFVRLMMWEALEGGSISMNIWKTVRGPLFYRVKELVDGTKRAGKIPAEFDAAHLIITFLGASSFYYAYAPTLKDMIEHAPLSEGALQERHAQLDLVLGRIFG